MNEEIWQQLLSLESRDVVAQWFQRIHGRELNARRSKEISAAAKQAREYFRNASGASYSVRPLLTFYGVACLSRSLSLLLKVTGGEESLKGSHGLETVDWGSILSVDTTKSLRSLADLKIRLTAGLFSELLEQTNNRICIHINSSSVDWDICYDVPPADFEVSFGDLLTRLPDLRKELELLDEKALYASANELSYTKEAGARMKVGNVPFQQFVADYEANGYSYKPDSPYGILTASRSEFKKNVPQFVHAYIHKQFGAIPVLHVAAPFARGVNFSQLGMTYMVSYILGMLVRYYPTHWMALLQGDKGDALWPAVNRLQQVVESSYPELVIELIQHVLKQAEPKGAE